MQEQNWLIIKGPLTDMRHLEYVHLIIYWRTRIRFHLHTSILLKNSIKCQPVWVVHFNTALLLYLRYVQG